MLIYKNQQRSITMTKQDLLNFAKDAKNWNIAELPKGFKLYCVHGTKQWYSHGDLNDDDRLFLIAAPNKDAALTWARFEYLAMSDSSIKTYKELMNSIKENTVDENHSEYPRLDGYIDVGDFQFRSIHSVEKISKKEASIIIKRDAYDYSNVY